ncbi:uncharacterized protein LOC102380999 [Alligator sinensis]|uniref:Uncharacterized protein LOC102380999 n=1 Tax=Alligator sinensis TaxID=38654 RepID=A0A1U8DJ66_ALLSI|nr:uncharacterized protein LOC102380999 [Alligator sinensis]
MTDTELDNGSAALEDQREENAEFNTEETKQQPSHSATARAWEKDYCDYLLDSIDAQLSQLEWQGSGARVTCTSPEVEHTSLECSPDAPPVAGEEMKGCYGAKDIISLGEVGSSQKDEYSWRMRNLLGSEQTPENLNYQSDSNSICTEDFATRFEEGMVDPLVNFDEEGDVLAFDFSTEDSTGEGTAVGMTAGSTGPSFCAKECEGTLEVLTSHRQRKQEYLQQPKEELEDDLLVASTSGVERPQFVSIRNRRESLESLGGRISRLSQSNTMHTSSSMGTERASSTGIWACGHLTLELVRTPEESASWPTVQGSEGLEDSSRWAQPLSGRSRLLLEELSPGQLFKALDVSASHTRSWDGRTAQSLCTRRQAEHRHFSPDHPSHTTTLTSTSNGSSIASEGQIRSQLITLLQTSQGLSPELGKPMEQWSALQGSAVNNHLSSRPVSAQMPTGKAKDSCAPTQDRSWEVNSLSTVSRQDPRTDTELTQQEVVTPPRQSGKDIAYAVDSDGIEEVWASSELEHQPAERRACYLNPCPDSDTRVPKSCGLNLAPDSSSSVPNKDKHVAVPDYNSNTLHWPLGNSLGCLGSSNDEEEEEKECLQSNDSTHWRSSSLTRVSLSPSRAAASSWKQSKREICLDHKLHPGSAWARAASTMEVLTANKVILEESITKLRQDLDAEEERLLQQKDQVKEANLSLSDILLQKQHTVQELESQRGALEKSQKEAQKLESHVKETQSKADEARVDLMLLKHKPDSCLWELPKREELSIRRWHHCATHGNQLGVFQDEVASVVPEWEQLKMHVHHLEGSLSPLNHQKLKQQGDRTRTEELQEKQEAGLSEQNQSLSRQSQPQVVEQAVKSSALEKILFEKNLELQQLQEAVSALTLEKESQKSALESLKEEHERQLEEVHKEKELALAQQREDLQHQKQQELQEFAETLEQVKDTALQDQSSSFQKKVENLTRIMEAQDAKLRQQQEAMRMQKEHTQQLLRELRAEAKEMVQNALLQGQSNWEAKEKEALRMQCETLEEQSHRVQADLQKALEKERRKGSALQTRILELQKQIQDLELLTCSLKQEKQVALEDLQTLLQEEKMEALQKLREELEQETIQERDQLRARLRQLEEKQCLLQAKQSEASFWEQEALSSAEWAEHSVAREIGLVCQHLQDLLPERARGQSASWMAHRSPSYLSPGHALQILGGLREEIQHYLRDLQQEIEAQKHTILQVQMEKKWELRQQQEQLHLEKEEALEALKEQLIQEHIQEIATLQHSELKEAMGEKQLCKDSELWAIQGSWKDQVACKLTQRLEKELDVEMETHSCKDRHVGLQRAVERPDSEARHLSSVTEKHLSPAKARMVTEAWHDSGALKLLHHLQGRVRKLRIENAINHWGSLEDLASLQGELGHTF